MKKMMYMCDDKVTATLAHLQELIGDKELEVKPTEVEVFGLNEKAGIADCIFKSDESIDAPNFWDAVCRAEECLRKDNTIVYIPRRLTNRDAVQILAVAKAIWRNPWPYRKWLVIPDPKTGENVTFFL